MSERYSELAMIHNKALVNNIFLKTVENWQQYEMFAQQKIVVGKSWTLIKQSKKNKNPKTKPNNEY